ncbi:MAG: VOC family protein [Thermoplasmata archaeon]|nr:VOC family protein [Thermoplasmata archaeon]
MKQGGRQATTGTKIAVKGITPFLWYESEAEGAARLYVSIFQRSRILEVSRAGPSTGRSRGPVQTVTFELSGLPVIAFNGGPTFKFTPATSLFVSCTTQAQVDAIWRKLLRGGKESRCGWLVDRFGLSWQIIPTRLIELLDDPDPERAGKALDAMMGMQKIDIAALERAVATA